MSFRHGSGAESRTKPAIGCRIHSGIRSVGAVLQPISAENLLTVHSCKQFVFALQNADTRSFLAAARGSLYGPGQLQEQCILICQCHFLSQRWISHTVCGGDNQQDELCSGFSPKEFQ